MIIEINPPKKQGEPRQYAEGASLATIGNPNTLVLGKAEVIPYFSQAEQPIFVVQPPIKQDAEWVFSPFCQAQRS